MHVLITGGAGFIGSHTADALLHRGDTVRVLDNLQKPVHLRGKPDYLSDDIEFVFGDVRDREALAFALEGVDAVLHLAAYQDYLPDFSTYFHVNSVSTALLYELIVERKLAIKRVVVASSQAVLGEGAYACEEHGEFHPDIRVERQLQKAMWNHCCPSCGRALTPLTTPERAVNPRNQYALSKHSQEEIALSLGKRYEIPSVALRYSIVQGPRQSFYNAYSGAMRIFALSLYFDRAPTIYEDGEQLRDYVNIGDVVRANLIALDDPRAELEVFNVGGGKGYSVRDFYETMQQVVGKRLDPRIGHFYRYGDTRHIVSDISKLKSLGWEPSVSIEQSIADYWAYLVAQRNIENILEYADRTMASLNVVRVAGASGSP